MNYLDYLIGVGFGVLVTLIISSIKRSREEKASEEKAGQQNISQRFSLIESKQSDLYYATTAMTKRIEKLENLTKPLNEISIKALHDNYANILIAVSKDKRK